LDRSDWSCQRVLDLRDFDSSQHGLIRFHMSACEELLRVAQQNVAPVSPATRVPDALTAELRTGGDLRA
jgi:hypothetical protein